MARASAAPLIAALTAAAAACDSDTGRIVVEENNAPTAKIVAPSEVGAGELARLEGTGSSDSDGIISAYQWDFGDGTPTSSTAIAFHAFNEAGTFTVRLTVTDNDDATATATAAVRVRLLPSNQPPVARIMAPTRGDPNVPVLFDATGSSDPDGTIVSYEWTLGSGGPSATGTQVSHTFAVAGTHEVMLAVTDDRGARSTATHAIDVGMPPQMRPPVADAGSDRNVALGETVMFDASASFDPDGNIVTYDWDFGDGTTATGVTAMHVYNVEASFPVALTVTDDDGLMAVDTATITAGQPTFDGMYSMVANPSMQQCGISPATFVATTLTFRTMGAVFIAETPDPQMPMNPISMMGTLTGSTFSVSGTWRERIGAVHTLQLQGTFNGTHWMGTMNESIALGMIPLCSLVWNLSGDKLN